MKITPMTGRTGEPVANQYVIIDGWVKYFQSYETIIARIDKNGAVVLDQYMWNCSTTTSKYRNKFLGMTTVEIEQEIECGDITLADLN